MRVFKRNMEQEDYLLREIKRIGVIISAILQKTLGGKGNLAITLEHQIEDTKGMLLHEMMEKALQHYNLCNLKSQTYSFEREVNINAIKNVLQKS